MDKFYITTAIPYVNAAPHLGHVLEFVQTDVLARYQRLRGRDVALITGADENSLKNVHAAEKKGITVTELCEKNSAVFKQVAEKVGLSFTNFRRTSDKKMHWPGVQNIWALCDKSGDIYKKKYRGLYCVGCEAFYEEDELTEGLCPEHRVAPEAIEEENYFFKLSKYQDTLEKMIESGELQILPETRKNEVLSFIKGGLKDFSISRSVTRAKGWGVPVPNDPKQILYVWFDALGTYITGIGYGTDQKTFERYWPADVHVIGKGILRFHAVYWPAMLLSAGLKLPKTVFVHGYITVEGQKMSKSLGNIVDPVVLTDKYGVDPIRYCLLGEVPTFEDGDFSEKVLMDTNNNELLANLGNLVNRTLVFIKNNFDATIPGGDLNDEDKRFLESQAKLAGEITSELDKMRIKDALHKVMAYSKNANRYFQDNKPWVSVKSDKARASAVIGVLATQVKDLSIMIEPFLPQTSVEIGKQLSIEAGKWSDIGKPLPAGHAIGEPKPLFRKIEPKDVEADKGKAMGKKGAAVSFADLDLEVGQIISAEKHPDAEKLFIEKVMLSDGERQIVSGLAGHYFPEELVGKKVVILKNLAPAKLRGVESQGMLLAAEGHEKAPPKEGGAMEQGAVEVIFCEKSKVGEKVSRKDGKNAPKPVITFDEFKKVKIDVKDFAVMNEGKQLASGSEELRMKNVKEGNVS
ncbi:MAG: methionine--tRNA ligase [Candidatus ainarchaeum sp.]|nr:methionine--tRNA ligase [Candidatus ainarchaeum sp.]